MRSDVLGLAGLSGLSVAKKKQVDALKLQNPSQTCLVRLRPREELCRQDPTEKEIGIQNLSCTCILL